jgi:hypothetical protein
MKRALCMTHRRRLLAAPGMVCGIVVATLAGGAAQGAPTQSQRSVLVSRSVEAPAAPRSAYVEDAERLAARYLRDLPPAPRDIRLPKATVDSLYNALMRVYALSHPARTAVVERYAIHTYPDLSTRELMVVGNEAAPWAVAWARGERATGHAVIDALMGEAALTMKGAPGPRAFVLQSPEPLNMVEVARRFSTVEGVWSAEPTGYPSSFDGPDIRAESVGQGWRLHYRYTWGDCRPGCKTQHTWTFFVASDAKATFDGETGMAVPQGENVPMPGPVTTRAEADRLKSDPLGVWKASWDGDLFFEVVRRGAALEGRVVHAPGNAPVRVGDVMLKLNAQKDGTFAGELKVYRMLQTTGDPARKSLVWRWTEAADYLSLLPADIPSEVRRRQEARDASRWTAVRVRLDRVRAGHGGLWSQLMLAEYEELSLPIVSGDQSGQPVLTWRKFEPFRGCCGEALAAFTPRK